MSESLTLPVLPLRDTVMFPGVTTPIGAGRSATKRAIETAVSTNEKLVFAVSQRHNIAQVTPEVLHTIGTVARVGQLQRVRGGYQLLLTGEYRGIAMRISEADRYLEAVVREADEMMPTDLRDPAYLALQRELRERAAEVGEKAGLPQEVIRQVLAGVEEPGRLADLVASYLEVPHNEKQALLETLAVEERLRQVLLHVQRQISVLDAQEDIKSKVQQELGDRQREMVLREQLKAIREELGDTDDAEEVDELAENLRALDLPPEVRKEVDREVNRLGRMARESMEYQVIRTYLETVAELPWNDRTDDDLDQKVAAGILDEDHYGLEDVKDRVLEFLAVRQLKIARAAAEEAGAAPDAGESEDEAESVGEIEPTEVPTASATDDEVLELEAEEATDDGSGPRPEDDISRAPILLFLGPPGVGKTSIARSIARAMSRKYVRISLGGARDEADIRGHRRTYVGAMPGRIIQGMRQAGSKNPVFLLDEVDKLGVSYQGDPASGLLEVLDPAQNNSFVDHYLGVPFDLSEVLFIATANFVQSIPGPLRDRMEIVEFSGYTEGEKLEIARRYLLPRQVKDNALESDQIEVADEAISEVITRYTREAGVRQLERELGKLARKVARKIAAGEVESQEVEPEQVRELLGRPRIFPERAFGRDQIGIATAMYYTPAGGDIMFVEATTMPGKGNLVLTGHLGDVMKESAQAAWSYARSHAADLGIDSEHFELDVHIHVPAGAIPKDGPSAGVTMATALVSTLSGRPVRHDIAMTGELTLSGRVLPIGGVKEKILGAFRAGIRTIVLPQENLPDLEDLPDEVREELEATPVAELGEVLAMALRGGRLEKGRLLFSEETTGDDLAEGDQVRH
jgi:ATP-dependent Lon protease